MAGNNRRHGKSRVPTETMKRNKELRAIRHEKRQGKLMASNMITMPHTSMLNNTVDTWSQYRRDAKRAARKYNISKEA